MLALLLACLLVANATVVSEQPRVLYERQINVDNKWQPTVTVCEGDEPADAIFSALRPYGLNHDARRTVFEEVKRAGVPYTREYARVFSQEIVLENGSFSGTFVLDDDGSEPVDAVYNFAKQHGIETHYARLTEALLPKLCEIVPCSRRRPRIWYNEITIENGRRLGALEILEGDEAVDTVDGFVQRISVDVGDRSVFRRNLLGTICKDIVCSRTTPVVFRKAIKDQDGNSNGAIEIYENEEVIDAVVRFIRKSGLSFDEIR